MRIYEDDLCLGLALHTYKVKYNIAKARDSLRKDVERLEEEVVLKCETGTREV